MVNDQVKNEKNMNKQSINEPIINEQIINDALENNKNVPKEKLLEIMKDEADSQDYDYDDGGYDGY